MSGFYCVAAYIDAVQKDSRLGGYERNNDMREIHRPIHSSYETLRLRRDLQTREMQFNRRIFVTNEQLTALGYAVSRRPQGIFDQGSSR
jgi:hypothetical protein